MEMVLLFYRRVLLRRGPTVRVGWIGSHSRRESNLRDNRYILSVLRSRSHIRIKKKNLDFAQ
jgi:hypothetical protein